jgi:hypothetical protein
MAKDSISVLKTLHKAIKQGDLEGHILAPHLGPNDMQVLKKRLDAGTLMSGFTTVADAPSKAAAVRKLPNDLGRVVAKLPASKVKSFGTHLNSLPRSPRGVIICNC